MCAKKVDDDIEMSEGSNELDEFVSKYTGFYRSYLAEKDMDERHMPQFYKGFPFVTEIFKLPNEAVCVLFRKSNRSKVLVLEGEYDDVKSKMDERAFDFMQVFPPYTTFTPDEAERLARIDADRDLRTSRRLEILGATEVHMEEMHEDVESLLTLNPWLDEQTKTQKDKLEKAQVLLQELYKEVEIDDDERFADYNRSFMEIMAFERAEIEEVAGEMEVHLESALEDFDERMEKIEENFETYGKAANKSMGELEQKFKDLERKIGNIDAEGGLDEEFEIALTKVRSSLKDNSSKMNEFKKDLNTVKKELTVSQEIKDTVFRDSKRTHNLNERITDLETKMGKIPKTDNKATKSDLKALQGKMNVLKSDLRLDIKDLEKEVNRKITKLRTEIPPPPPEDLPPGAKVKRTTKKTTKKTTRKQ